MPEFFDILRNHFSPKLSSLIADTLNINFGNLFHIGNDERYRQLHSGMVLSECIAQRNEHDKIRKEFQDLEERRHAALIQREFDLDRELTEKQKIKDENRKQYLKNIQSFQFIQADKRRRDEKEAKLSSDKSRRSVGTVLNKILLITLWSRRTHPKICFH